MSDAVQAPSAHCDPRPAWALPELVVIHCISLPEDVFGTGAPERLFTGCLDTGEHPSFADLDGVHVAPHLLIDRDGAVTQFVAFDERAWHAGVSAWRGREACNDFSIGIELEGSVHQGYTDAQYAALEAALAALFGRYPSISPENVVGHAEIAPGRKADPGPYFDWRRIWPGHRAQPSPLAE